jgi:hypothetical protein
MDQQEFAVTEVDLMCNTEIGFTEELQTWVLPAYLQENEPTGLQSQA